MQNYSEKNVSRAKSKTQFTVQKDKDCEIVKGGPKICTEEMGEKEYYVQCPQD